MVRHVGRVAGGCGSVGTVLVDGQAADGLADVLALFVDGPASDAGGWTGQWTLRLDRTGSAVAAVAGGLAVLEDVEAAVRMLEDVPSDGTPALRTHLAETAAVVALISGVAARTWLGVADAVLDRYGTVAGPDDALSGLRLWLEDVRSGLAPEVAARLEDV